MHSDQLGVFPAPPDPEPPDSADVLWRYLTFPKFVALLQDRALWFASLDTLDDPFEGARSRPLAELEANVWGRRPPSDREQFLPIVRALEQQDRRCLLVNCWQILEHESEAMWSLYCSRTEGIAIQTTAGRLRSCLDSSPEPVKLNKVVYLDFQTEFTPGLIIQERVFYKRREFRDEREVRALVNVIPVIDDEHPTALEARRFDQSSGGLNIGVELASLVAEIRVAPRARKWFRKLVERTVGDYDLDIPVLASSLDGDPEYGLT